jgi:EmrB/QacA subfamily drug resistance transporter
LNEVNRRWWVLIAVGTGSFMSALDGSVVNTILPVIQDVFHSSVTTIEWIVTVYLLSLSGFLLTFGRLGDLRGHKAIYVWGFGIFVVSSAFCGAAQSVEMLIACRGIQAIGGAMLASNASAILTDNFPPEQRGRALGLVSMMTYLGLTIGPSLGGWLAESFTWRAVFYINVPVGALALALSLFSISKGEPKNTNQKFDLIGAALLLAGLIALILGLNQGAEWGWASFPIVGLFLSASILLAVFVRVERHTPSPMLDLNLFRIPLFSAATVSAILNYICLYSITFLMPYYLIQGRGMNAAQAGLLLTAEPIIMTIVAPISGVLSDRIGSRWPGMVGMAIFSASLFLLATSGSTTPFPLTGLFLALAGLGTGIFISPNTSALMGSAPKHRQGIASGIQAAARNIGMVLGVGLAGAIFTSYLAKNTPQALFRGIDIGFLAAGGVAAMGIIMSALKEK